MTRTPSRGSEPIRAARHLALLGALHLLLAPGGNSLVYSTNRYEANRAGMIEAIRDTVRRTTREIGKASLAPAVMSAMGRVPRHEFVPAALRSLAYENRPLPIGHGQTISQPYIVALMTDLLGVGPGDRVLEIGTGSGYQAAVLAALETRVFTMEIVEPLAKSATVRLRRLGYRNIEVRFADGYYGWPEKGPFDAIVVTAAASHVPPPLIEQLKAGAGMVIPVGGRFTVQQLLLVKKSDDGEVYTRQVLPVRFVPLTGQP